MTRQILERLVLVALPFLAYGAYLVVLRFLPSPPPGQRQHPWTWLLVAGLALFAASFIVWGITEGEPTTGTYVAPHTVNGQIVPGYVVPDKKPQ
jgi:drug/metabolite transporter (DMT)-like permease